MSSVRVQKVFFCVACQKNILKRPRRLRAIYWSDMQPGEDCSTQRRTNNYNDTQRYECQRREGTSFVAGTAINEQKGRNSFLCYLWLPPLSACVGSGHSSLSPILWRKYFCLCYFRFLTWFLSRFCFLLMVTKAPMLTMTPATAP